MYYIVPTVDQTPAGFVIRRDSATVIYMLPLEENTVTQLRSLARWLDITGKGRATKPELVEEIQKRLTLVPMEVAAAAHPILAFNMPKTSALCAERVATLVRLSRQDPTVRVHAGWAIEQAEAQMRTLVAEEMRAAHAAAIRREQKRRANAEAQRDAAGAAGQNNRSAPPPSAKPTSGERAAHLSVLGVKEDTPAAIRSAYRRLVLQFHPDKNSAPDAPAKFGQVQAAYEALTGSA